jgi:hypothetical protein
LGQRSTNRIDEVAKKERKTYIAKQTLADKSIPSSDKKQIKFILQKGVTTGGNRGRKKVHKFELK